MDSDLYKLYKLHLVDAAISMIRRKAAAIDPGRSIIKEVDKLHQIYEFKAKTYTELKNELEKLESNQKESSERQKRIEKELYTPGIGSREVENYQREIDSLKRQNRAEDARIIELWELVPFAKENATSALKLVNVKKAELKQHQSELIKVKQNLEAEFNAQLKLRPKLAKDVKPTLLEEYNQIKNHNHGIGMALIKKDNTCEQCGTSQAERKIQKVMDDRVATCDSCHRILFILHTI